MFTVYLQLGFDHITDIGGFDHFLFLLSVCALYRWQDWRRLLWMVTAFTVGHSLTLALAALGYILPDAGLIESLVALTILMTAIYNLYLLPKNPTEAVVAPSRNNYLFVLLFGLIHGLAFSNFLRASLMPGEESDLITQLLAFNLGVELGQLLLVAIIIGLSYVFQTVLKVWQRDWIVFVSGAAAGLAVLLLVQRTVGG